MTDSGANAFQKAFFARSPSARSVMALFDSLPDVSFYAKDLKSRFIRVNERFTHTHGGRREADIIGKTDRDFHPPAMAEAYIAEDRRVMSRGRPIPGQVWLVHHADKIPNWYVSTKVPLFDHRGKVVGIAGAMYPIERPAEQERYFRELAPVIRHIELHYADSISMADMAALVGLSSTHFNRRFRQLLRMTPTIYLRTIRIQTARRLLGTSNLTLAEIATDAGFADQSHFTKIFSRVTGLTPHAYRKHYRS